MGRTLADVATASLLLALIVAAMPINAFAEHDAPAPLADQAVLFASPEEQAVGARAKDGAFAIIYVPGIRSVEVDLAELSGPRVTADWYDPAIGSKSALERISRRAARMCFSRPA